MLHIRYFETHYLFPECANDAFGGNCSYTCTRCSEGKGRLCDAVTGVCIYGCIPGYNGTNCSQGKSL